MRLRLRKNGLLAVFSMAAMIVFILSCGGGGGGGGGGGTPGTFNTVSGVASKGFVAGGTVIVYEIKADGKKGKELARGKTDSAGNYTVEADYDGPVLIEVTGGEYRDEATGARTPFSGPMRAAMPALTGNDTVAITPLTELAVRKAETGAAGLTAEKISGANDLMSQLIGDADILSTLPTDCLNGDTFTGADSDAQNYAMLLAALSQMAQTAGKDIFDLLDDIQNDMDDGQMDATGDGLLDALEEFLTKNPNNDTGMDSAPELASSIEKAKDKGLKSVYEIVYPYLQYRTFEDLLDNSYRAWFTVTKDGGPIQATDLSDVEFYDPNGKEVDPFNIGGGLFSYMSCNCEAASCSDPITIEETGVWAHFDMLESGSYEIEVKFEDGQTESIDVPYPGKLELPVIQSIYMQSQMVGNDLKLSWTNPAYETNWDEVDQLRIILFDNNGLDVLYVRVDPQKESVTLPAATLNQAMAIGSGGLAEWHIQTRAYDENSMNFARGVSDKAELPGNYEIGFFHLQYRAFEDPNFNRFQGSFGLELDNSPIDLETDFEVSLTDSSNTEVNAYMTGVFYGTSIWYDCSVDPCYKGDPYTDTGLWGHISSLSPGNYRLEVIVNDEQTLVEEVYYPGQLTLPIVSSASMSSNWVGDNLELSWVNPVNDTYWGEVDQLRIIVMDESGNEIIYARVDPPADTLTLPADLLDDAVGLNGGSSAVKWRIQTRAHEYGMNYARGYSDPVFIAQRTYAINYIHLMYRRFESSDAGYVVMFDLSNQGAPAAEAQVTSYSITGPTGPIDPASSNFYQYKHISYDCMRGTCAQSGPDEGAGLWNQFDSLPSGFYSIVVNMENGETLNAMRIYPEQLVLPYISSATMSAVKDNGNLNLSWTNPTNADNWDDVGQLRIVLFDDQGRDVLYIRVHPDDETLTIPKTLVDQAAALLGGSALTQWQIQTRAFFLNSMNYARAYSDKKDIE